MPRIGGISGIIFYVYAKDHNPPHVHAICGEDEMMIAIATGEILRGSPLRGSKLREALLWLETHRELAAAAWARLNP